MIWLKRPEDPELARLWDEAKRACEERAGRSSIDPERMDRLVSDIRDEDRSGAAIVALAHESNLITAEELLAVLDEDCCVGDLSRCRCVPPSDEERERRIAEWRNES